MAHRRRREGTTPFGKLRTHYDQVDLTCPECGYDDDDGSWKAKTTGDRVQYRHICPSCGARRSRTLRMK